MKGRKPKHSTELIAELAQRVAAGENVSALAREKGMPRSSIMRCANSARLPAEVKSQGMSAADHNVTVRQREKLFWMFVETFLRQAISLAPKSTAKEAAVMLEAAVKLKTILPVARTPMRPIEYKRSQETLAVVHRFLEEQRVIEAQNAPGARVENTPKRDLDAAISVAPESPSDGEDDDATSQA